MHSGRLQRRALSGWSLPRLGLARFGIAVFGVSVFCVAVFGVASPAHAGVLSSETDTYTVDVVTGSDFNIGMNSAQTTQFSIEGGFETSTSTSLEANAAFEAKPGYMLTGVTITCGGAAYAAEGSYNIACTWDVATPANWIAAGGLGPVFNVTYYQNTTFEFNPPANIGVQSEVVYVNVIVNIGLGGQATFGSPSVRVDLSWTEAPIVDAGVTDSASDGGNATISLDTNGSSGASGGEPSAQSSEPPAQSSEPPAQSSEPPAQSSDAPVESSTPPVESSHAPSSEATFAATSASPTSAPVVSETGTPSEFAATTSVSPDAGSTPPLETDVPVSTAEPSEVSSSPNAPTTSVGSSDVIAAPTNVSNGSDTQASDTRAGNTQFSDTQFSDTQFSDTQFSDTVELGDTSSTGVPNPPPTDLDASVPAGTQADAASTSEVSSTREYDVDFSTENGETSSAPGVPNETTELDAGFVDASDAGDGGATNGETCTCRAVGANHAPPSSLGLAPLLVAVGLAFARRTRRQPSAH